MPDYIGNIAVPEFAPSGVFPITPDYGRGRSNHPDVVVHQFGSGNAKIEQRFLLGAGAKRFTVRRMSGLSFLRNTNQESKRTVLL